MNGRSMSIRGYLTRALLLGAGLLVLGTALLLDGVISFYLLDRFDEDMLKRAQALITLTKKEGDKIELDFAGEFMPEFEEPEGGEFFEIWLADGSLVERSESLEGRALRMPQRLYEEPVFENYHLYGGDHARLLRLSFLPQDDIEDVEGDLDPSARPHASATLFLVRQREDFDRLLIMMNLLIWGALGLMLASVVVLVRFAVRRGLAPLDAIRDQVEAIDPKALDTRIELPQPVLELNPVVDQLNAMLVRLNEGVQRERRFSSDVAHELRTPLAELRTLAEVGNRDPGDEAMVLHFFTDVREITLEMQELVHNLLELSRCDSGNQRTILEPIEPQTLIDHLVRRGQKDAQANQIALDVTIADRISWNSDSRLLEHILQNLLNNAITYSPKGSTVCVGAEARRISISNPAPNLIEADLKHMFDRFWQKSSARTGGKNAGLGLSLVASFTEMLGIRIHTTLEQGIFRVCLEFPNPH